MKRKLKFGFVVTALAVVSALVFAACGKDGENKTPKGEELADQAAYQAILDSLPTAENTAGEGKGIEVVMKINGAMMDGEIDVTVTSTINGSDKGFAKISGTTKESGTTTPVSAEGYFLIEPAAHTLALIVKKDGSWVETEESNVNYTMLSTMFMTASQLSLSLDTLLPANLSDLTYSDGTYSFSSDADEATLSAKVAFKDGKIISFAAENNGMSMSFTFSYGKTVTIPEYTPLNSGTDPEPDPDTDPEIGVKIDAQQYAAILSKLPTAESTVGAGKAIGIALKVNGQATDTMTVETNVEAVFCGTDYYAKVSGSYGEFEPTNDINKKGYVRIAANGTVGIFEEGGVWKEVSLIDVDAATGLFKDMYFIAYSFVYELSDLLPENFSELTYSESDGAYTMDIQGIAVKISFKGGKISRLRMSDANLAVDIEFSYGKDPFDIPALA